MINENDLLEEFGDGYTNELERIHAQVKLETTIERADVTKFSEYGFYTLLILSERFCVWTDAFLGYDEFVASVSRSIEEIESEMHRLENLGFYCAIVPKGKI